MRLSQYLTAAWVVYAASCALASEGLQTVASHHNVERTMNRLERAVRMAGFRVFARIDHSRGADRVGVRLRPTQVLIFGKPEVGSVFLQADQRVGIDLPLRYLVWLDADGNTQISWNAPSWLAQRHTIEDRDQAVDMLTRTLDGLARDAAAP